MVQHPARKAEAEAAAAEIYRRMDAQPGWDGRRDITVGLVLGTGWGDALVLHGSTQIPFGEIPGFEALGALEEGLRQLHRPDLSPVDEVGDLPQGHEMQIFLKFSVSNRGMSH